MRDISTICLVGDWLHGRPDEGIHNLARNLSAQWETAYSVRTLSVGADLPVNRSFLSRRLCKTLREIRPDLVVYISPSSAKAAALFRAKVLKIYSPRSRVFVIATQPVSYGSFERPLVRLLSPDGIFVQSPRGKQRLHSIRCPVHFLPSGVDTSRFVPVDEIQKRTLRRKYNTDEDAFVVLHVGHINRARNVQAMGRVARLAGVRVVVVGSTKTPQDEDLARELIHAGVHLIREFVPRIEEIYQLADMYMFPVVSEDAAIGVPLSVLEAMACNLPVITTPFGGLPWMFEKKDGFMYFEDEDEVPELISKVRRIRESSTRQMVEPYDWKNVASGAMDVIQSRKSS